MTDSSSAPGAPTAVPAPADTSVPVVLITAPTSSANYSTSSASIAISGRASDDVGVLSVAWANDRGGSGTASGSNDWSVAGIALQSGVNVITISARDAAGNTGRTTLTITYTPSGSGGSDAQSPIVSIVSPTGTGTYATSTASIALSGTASDNVGVTSVSWSNSRGGSGNATGQSQWSVASVPLQTGTNNLTVTARDAAGNVATATLVVTYSVADSSPPSIALTAPTTSATYTSSTSSISVAGTATDNIGVSQVTWVNDRGGSGTATGTATWTVGAIALQSGTNTLTFTARDSAGNATSRTLTVSFTRSGSQTFYLSPSGNDANDGVSSATPLKSFARAFSAMTAGDELVLLDGTYSAAAGTGTIHWNNGSASAQVPSGTAQRPTVVRAQNPGSVRILGPLFVGRSNRKDSYIRVQGVTFEGGGSLYNSSFVTLKDVGFHGPFDIGTNDHDQGNTDNLVEDAWIWSAGVRVVAINYRAHRNVWRRVVVRGDGCGTSECSGSGNPNVGFTVYDSMDVSVQNVMVIDRVLAGTDSPYADFACAQHTADPRYYFGRNEWLGVLSLNAPDIGFYCEPDSGGTVDPTVRIQNAAIWNAAQGAFNLARAGTNNLIENLLAHSLASDGVRIAPELASLGGTLRNVIVLGSGRYALNSAYPAAYVSMSGSWSAGLTNQTSPSTVIPGDPRSNGALKHPVRVEAGSNLKGQGAAGADVGPSILVRYGTDGTRHGEPGYNTRTTAALWPWPNEARIKAEMCASTTRGFCSAGRRLDNVNPVTLTSYVWEALGTPMPASVGP